MPESSTVTIIFTDLVDSTGIHDRLGDEAADRLRRSHFLLLTEVISGNGGREVKRLGDGIMAAFSSAGDAIAAAVAIQKGTSGSSGNGQAVAVRVGINAGEVTKEDGDYYGAAVNVAARLCQAASGGDILTTDVVRALVGNRGGHLFERLGGLQLKGFADPVQAWSVQWRPGATLTSEAGALRRRAVRWTLQMPSALTPPNPTGFVGRAENVAGLESTWKQVLAGERRLVLLSGEPGIGKTRLCTEFCGRVHAQGALVLYGKADEEVVVPYQPFVESIGEALGRAPGIYRSSMLQEVGPEIGRLLPSARTLPPGSQDAGLDPDTERYRMFEAVTSLLATLAGSPLVIVLDDLHWADKPSLLLLRHVARSPKLKRVLIIGTYRETDLDRRHPLSEALGDLRRDPGYERVLLRGLSADEVRQWMENAAGHEFSGRGLEVPKAIHRETEGNPFFIGEVIRHMVETGRFVRREGVWVYNAESVAALGLPEGIRDVVSRRLAQLSDATNRVLSHAAVIGREFEFAVLVDMVGDAEAALSAVEEAIDRGLLVEIRERRSAAYGFTHALVRQTLYDEMTMPRRQKLHLRAAEAVERVHGKDVTAYIAALAVHYRTAGAAADPEKAVDYSIRAGRAAYSAAAYEEAVSHLEAALQLIEEEDVALDRQGQVLEYLGDLMHVTGIDRARGIAYLERALALYEREGRLDRIVQVRSRLGRSYSSFPATMNIPKALEHYHAAEAMISGLPESAPVGYLYLGVAAADLYCLRINDGFEAVDRALAVAEASANEGLWVQAAAIKAWLLTERGQITDGYALVEEAWTRADQLGHVLGAFFATWIGSGINYYHRGARGWLRVCQRELETGRLDQIPEQRDILVSGLANGYLQMGEVARARKIDDEVETYSLSTSRVLLLLIDGRWEEAVERTREEWRHRREQGLLVFAFAPGFMNLLGVGQRILENREGEMETLNEAQELYVSTGSVPGRAYMQAFEAQRLVDDGRLDDARALLVGVHRDLDVEQWGGLDPRLTMLEAEIGLLAGDDPSQASSLADQAVAKFGTYPELVIEQEYYLRWAMALGRAGHRDKAQTQFDALRDSYTRHGFAERWLDRLETFRSRSA